MANTHYLFKHYNSVIRLSDTDRFILLTVRDGLRKKMKEGFAAIPDKNGHELDFQSQGSVVTDLIIKPVADDFDLDDGVYFQGNLPKDQRAKPEVFHKWVRDSIGEYDQVAEIIEKTTCIRVKFKKGFHIDIPVYYADNYVNPDLAHLEEGWMLSNPVEFIAWFEEKAKSSFQKAFLLEGVKFAEPYEKWLSDIRKEDCQLRRIVRYMKAWADLKKGEMPCGIIMTILAAINYVENERDDIAFRDTLVNIQTYLQANGIKCPRPTVPLGEDLFENTSEPDKQSFMTALKALITSANKAIMSNSNVEASQEWANHFKDRWPSHLVSKVAVKREPSITALHRIAATSKPWSPKMR
jgi:hypothetical protein